MHQPYLAPNSDIQIKKKKIKMLRDNGNMMNTIWPNFSKVIMMPFLKVLSYGEKHWIIHK